MCMHEYVFVCHENRKRLQERRKKISEKRECKIRLVDICVQKTISRTYSAEKLAGRKQGREQGAANRNKV